MITEHGNTIASPDQLQENRIIGELNETNSTISFKGKGNILYLDGNVKINNSDISFLSNNAVIYLTGSEKKDYQVKLDCWRSSTIYIGGSNYFNSYRVFSATASERKHIIIGGDGVFSFDIWIRTADPHLIYDCESHQRINPSKNVLIGDHVWLGQSTMILKGSVIGSGSIIGAGSIVSGKRIPSNCIYAGNPAKPVKENVFFSSKSVHNYTKKSTKESMVFEGDDFIFDDPASSVDERKLFSRLDECKTAEEKIDVLKKILVENHDRNRFTIKNDLTVNDSVTGGSADGSHSAGTTSSNDPHIPSGSSSNGSHSTSGIRGLFRRQK